MNINRYSVINVIVALVAVAAVAVTVFLYTQTKKLDLAQNPLTQVINPAAPKKAKLHINLKTTPTVKQGQVLTTHILLENNPQVLKNGAHLFVKYDPKILQVQDEIATQSGVQIAVYTKVRQYDVIKKRDADNVAGVVDIDLFNKDPNKILSSDYFATINFKVVGIGQARISVDPAASSVYFLQPNNPADIIYNNAVVTIQ